MGFFKRKEFFKPRERIHTFADTAPKKSFFGKIGQHNKNLFKKKISNENITQADIDKLKLQGERKKLLAEQAKYKSSFFKTGYITAGKVVKEHRRRLLAREEYRVKRLELRGAQQEKKQLLIPKNKFKGPLSDSSLKPIARNANNAGIRKVKGPGPLSDKNFNKKVKEMNKGEI